jgi:hypothetical protein
MLMLAGFVGTLGVLGVLGIMDGKRLSLGLAVMREAGSGLDTSPEQAARAARQSQRTLRIGS